MREQRLGFHLLLFFVTFLTVTFKEYVFLIFSFNSDVLSQVFRKEWPYSVSLMMILLCHEMGHYLPARYYGIRATLPYFIPMPFGPVGTMGAVIKIEDPIGDKKKLFDIGVGGPLMSLVLSVLAWLIGLYYSELSRVGPEIDKSQLLFFGDSLFTYWSGQWILGPYDPSNFDIMIHPLAKAGWVGLLVTAINLLPFGQLDGGHVIYAIFGEKYRNWIHHLFIAFIMLSLWNFTWLLWGFIIYFLIKVEHPYVPDSFEPIGLVRKILGIFMLVSLLFIFVPSPIMLGSEINELSIAGEIWQFINKLFH